MTAFYSPFTPYLNTNYVPTNIDRAQILELLREPEVEVAKLNAEIAHLQSELDQLEAQHGSLEQAIFDHYQLLSPFRRLPDDILQEIFLRCLPEKHNALMSTTEAPLLLGRVCSRWRRLAFHTPRLWATLHIPLPVAPTQSGLPYSMPTDMYNELCRDFDERFKLHCDAIHDWLTRSGSCPLSISLNPMDISSSSKNHEYIRAYFNILLHFSHRWRSLELTVPTRDNSVILASIPAGDLPMLEFLHLKFSRRVSHEEGWLKSGMLSTRSLRILQLAQFPFKFSSIDADFSRLTHLILGDVAGSSSRFKRFTIEETYKTLNRCKNLVHCVIDVVDTVDASNILTDMIPLPHLESLSIVDGCFHLATLLECLELPSLKTISFHTTFWPSTARRSPLITLLSRTSGQVESLTTDVQFFTLADLVECLELSPFLTHFTTRKSRLGVSREQSRLRNSFFPSKLRIMKTVLDLFLPNAPVPSIASSFEGEEDRCLCPHLHTIEIRDLMTFSDHDLLPFLLRKMSLSSDFRVSTSAFPRIARLREATITFPQAQELDLPFHLGRYGEGFKLTLKYPDQSKRVTPGNFDPSNGLIKREPGSDIF